VFIAGIIPGIIMALAMAVVVYFWARKKGYPVDRKATLKERLIAFKRAFLSLMTPLIIIGGILSGYFTPTESAIITCVYALILGLIVYRTIGLRDLKRILLETAISTAGILLIIAAAAVFGWVLAYERVPQTLSRNFLLIFSDRTVTLLMIMIILLVVGCFMETIAAITIMTPVFIPVITALEIDPVHFGVVLVLNLMIGLITPPVGLVLYTLSNISGVPFHKIAKATIPHLIVLTVVMVILCLVPQLSLFLPDLIFGRR
jgi:tripartite ATP-independent transporter DctM subunit